MSISSRLRAMPGLFAPPGSAEKNLVYTQAIQVLEDAELRLQDINNRFPGVIESKLENVRAQLHDLAEALESERTSEALQANKPRPPSISRQARRPSLSRSQPTLRAPAIGPPAGLPEAAIRGLGWAPAQRQFVQPLPYGGPAGVPAEALLALGWAPSQERAYYAGEF